jgi:hypothetical protein
MKKFRKLFEDGGLAQNTLLDKKKKPMSTATAEISFQSVKEVAEIGDEPSSKEASPNIVKKGGKTVIIKTLDQMREAKEKTEYDYEGDMARGQLQSIISNAQRVHDMLEDNDNLPEWVQSKITLAEDYISTVANYMMSEVDEEVKDEYARKVDKYLKKKHNKEEVEQIDEIGDPAEMYRKSTEAAKAKLQTMKALDKTREYEKKRLEAAKLKTQNEEVVVEMDNRTSRDDSIERRKYSPEGMARQDKEQQERLKQASPEMRKKLRLPEPKKVATPTNEEVELDEVSTKGYHSAAIKSRMSAAVKVMSSMGKDKEAKTKLDARNAGLKRLSDRTSAEMKKANSGPQKQSTRKEPTEAERRGYGQGRYMGDSVEVGGNQINEARPSQRHPLEGHEYHKKSDEALVHIAKDAHKAAEAMKSHNTDAENKYRDQANDSATVRHFRKTSGMPDWYKKKYGHMKEAFRPMDEPNMNLSIQARQKKADDANKLPFDGPYKKSTGVVTDKSGAKHGPMSIARHLARMAAKRQANVKESNEPLQESRKAEIVREAMKVAKEKKKNNSEDKFIADPELNSKVIKVTSQM